MYITKIYGTRFSESKYSRNEHGDLRNSRYIICRCFKSMMLGGKEIMPRRTFNSTLAVSRSKYNIRIRK